MGSSIRRPRLPEQARAGRESVLLRTKATRVRSRRLTVDVGEDKIYGEPPTENRWRLSWRNRAYFENHVQLDLELNAFSDEGFYPTYYKGEFKNDKPPETYAYLKRRRRIVRVQRSLSARINDWETTTEYRPKIEYTLITEPITNVFDNPLYLTARTEIAQPRHLFDNDLHLPQVDTLRIDLDTLVEYPFLAGPVKFTPFAGLRTTYYEYDLARDHAQERTGFTFGGEASMQLARDYGCRGGLFELDGLRHVIVPSIEYRQTTGVNLHPEELFQYDPWIPTTTKRRSRSKSATPSRPCGIARESRSASTRCSISTSR